MTKQQSPWKRFANTDGVYELHSITKAIATKENLANGIWDKLDALKALDLHGLYFMITPRAAERILKSKLRNRDEVNTTVNRYVKYIVNGLWDPRIVDSYATVDLRLIEAQHRLAAIVKTGKSIVYGVVIGVEEDINHNVGTSAQVKAYMALYRVLDFKVVAPGYTVTQRDVGIATSICTYLDGPLGSHPPRRHTTELATLVTSYLPELLDIAQYFPTAKRDGTVTRQVKAAFFKARLSGEIDTSVLYKCADILIDGGTEQQETDLNVMYSLRERLQGIKQLKGVKHGSRRDYPERLVFASTLHALSKVADGTGNTARLDDMKGGEINVVRKYVDLFPIPDDRKPAISSIPGSLHNKTE